MLHFLDLKMVYASVNVVDSLGRVINVISGPWVFKLDSPGANNVAPR